MASTNPKTNKPHKNDEKTVEPVKETKKHKGPVTEDDHLIESIEKHFGIEFTGDKEKFLEDASKAMLERSKREQQDDPVEEALYSEKVQTLRNKWADDVSVKENAKQKEIRKALEDEKIAVSVTFPDEKTYYLQSGGRNDSGNIDQPINAIISAANRLVNK